MGDGSGKWRLTVSSATEIGVMSLIFSPDGYLSNITSTSKYRVGDNGSALTCGSIDGGILMGDSVEPTFLGFFGNDFASDSIFNSFGSFGSAFSSTSIFNEFSDWGSPFSAESAFNEFASRPPIIQKSGQFVAFLTTNSTKSSSVDPNAVISTCTFFGSSRSSLHP